LGQQREDIVTANHPARITLWALAILGSQAFACSVLALFFSDDPTSVHWFANAMERRFYTAADSSAAFIVISLPSVVPSAVLSYILSRRWRARRIPFIVGIGFSLSPLVLFGASLATPLFYLTFLQFAAGWVTAYAGRSTGLIASRSEQATPASSAPG
jgi:hypothetical protein